MRTTINIEDDLFRTLKLQAAKSRVPLGRLFNATLRKGLEGTQAPGRAQSYKCPAYSMGEPRFNLDKALALADRLEELEILRDLQLRK